MAFNTQYATKLTKFLLSNPDFITSRQRKSTYAELARELSEQLGITLSAHNIKSTLRSLDIVFKSKRKYTKSGSEPEQDRFTEFLLSLRHNLDGLDFNTTPSLICQAIKRSIDETL